MNRKEVYLDQYTYEHLPQAIALLDSDKWLQLFHPPVYPSEHEEIQKLRLAVSTVLTALSALCGPQPDPITGLAPCGCGGVTEQTDFHDGFFPHSKIECLECGIEMMRAGNTILEAHTAVKRDWNKAHGYTDPPLPEVEG